MQGLQAQQKPVALSETDAQASAMGYKSDANKVDKAKYPRFQSGQNCPNCDLFQGDAKSGNGLCSIFPDKLVAAQGWCSAWIKKA